MAFKKTFVLSDESVNTHGFWILLAGMDLSGIQLNCPLYYEHRTWEIPCGHVENIRLKKDQLLGDVIIEGGNDIEKEYIRKIENGDLKGVSIGADPLEWSEEPALLKQGQTRATLSKCIPFEVSLAPLPGNKNALALRNDNSMIALSADKKYDFIPDINQTIYMKRLAILLGKGETATEDELMEALRPIMLAAKNAEAMQKVINDQLTVNLSAEKKAFFEGLLSKNVEQAMSFLTLSKEPAMEIIAEGAEEAKTAATTDGKAPVKISDLIQPGGGKKVELSKDPKETYDYLQKHNSVELGRIKKEEPEKFAQLQAEYAKGVRYVKA